MSFPNRYRVALASCVLFLITSLAVTACGDGASSPSPANNVAPATGYQLTWSDEFDGANGSAPDATKWAIQTGGFGWGNHELEYYTARPANVQVQNGNLVITAIKEDYTGPDKVSMHYTSARLQTKNLFAQQYGRFEASIKIPHGQGMWPAFWMLGSDIDTNPWPACGEIDIMENIGKEPSMVHGTLHAPGYTPEGVSASYTLPGGKTFADDYHLYAVEWEPQQVRFYVDGNLYATKTSTDSDAKSAWPFDHPFFVLLNLAVGGDWPGSPDATTQFPQQMLVDYVRVYQKK